MATGLVLLERSLADVSSARIAAEAEAELARQAVCAAAEKAKELRGKHEATLQKLQAATAEVGRCDTCGRRWNVGKALRVSEGVAM